MSYSSLSTSSSGFKKHKNVTHRHTFIKNGEAIIIMAKIQANNSNIYIYV